MIKKDAANSNRNKQQPMPKERSEIKKSSRAREKAILSKTADSIPDDSTPDDSLSSNDSHNDLLNPAQAAQLKGVTRAAIYTAIKEGRLPHIRIIGHFALRKADVLSWTPIRYGGRPGRASGRTPGTPLSPETKQRISEAQKRRWQLRKQTAPGSQQEI